MELLIPSARIVIVGLSAGVLLSLGLGSPAVVSRILVEPFFETARLWHLRRYIEGEIRPLPPGGKEHRLVHGLLGFDPQGDGNCDYRPLLGRIDTPTDVLVGRLPLEPPRDLSAVGWEAPSYTSEADRRALAANPLVTLYDGPEGSGHDVAESTEGLALLKSLAHRRLVEAARLQTTD